MPLLDVHLRYGGRNNELGLGCGNDVGCRNSRPRLDEDVSVVNLLAAAGLVLATGTAADAMLPHLAGLHQPPGRMQLVAKHPAGASAFVDYAHKPEALAKALEALRPHTADRLVVVFGCAVIAS